MYLIKYSVLARSFSGHRFKPQMRVNIVQYVDFRWSTDTHTYALPQLVIIHGDLTITSVIHLINTSNYNSKKKQIAFMQFVLCTATYSERYSCGIQAVFDSKHNDAKKLYRKTQKRFNHETNNMCMRFCYFIETVDGYCPGAILNVRVYADASAHRL